MFLSTFLPFAQTVANCTTLKQDYKTTGCCDSPAIFPVWAGLLCKGIAEFKSSTHAAGVPTAVAFYKFSDDGSSYTVKFATDNVEDPYENFSEATILWKNYPVFPLYGIPNSLYGKREYFSTGRGHNGALAGYHQVELHFALLPDGKWKMTYPQSAPYLFLSPASRQVFSSFYPIGIFEPTAMNPGEAIATRPSWVEDPFTYVSNGPFHMICEQSAA